MKREYRTTETAREYSKEQEFVVSTFAGGESAPIIIDEPSCLLATP